MDDFPIYRMNVQLLCCSEGVENPIEEDVLGIAELVFIAESGEEHPLFGDKNNRAGRFFYQECFGDEDLIDGSEARMWGEEFFADLYVHEPGTGLHKICDGTRTAKFIRRIWRPNWR